MSDRIGVLQSGRFVQVGTPNEIYTRPGNKFVSEFMGEVNVLPVQPGAGGTLDCPSLGTSFRGPEGVQRDGPGYLVVRPEFIRFVDDDAPAENVVTGTLYNEYALGSRIQYQVRVGERVFIVEKLRQQAPDAGLDTEVRIGWDGADSIVVGD